MLDYTCDWHKPTQERKTWSRSVLHAIAKSQPKTRITTNRRCAEIALPAESASARHAKYASRFPSSTPASRTFAKRAVNCATALEIKHASHAAPRIGRSISPNTPESASSATESDASAPVVKAFLICLTSTAQRLDKACAASASRAWLNFVDLNTINARDGAKSAEQFKLLFRRIRKFASNA
jgi:hypothetical protein